MLVYVCMRVYACMRAHVMAANVCNNIARHTAAVVGIQTRPTQYFRMSRPTGSFRLPYVMKGIVSSTGVRV